MGACPQPAVPRCAQPTRSPQHAEPAPAQLQAGRRIGQRDALTNRPVRHALARYGEDRRSGRAGATVRLPRGGSPPRAASRRRRARCGSQRRPLGREWSPPSPHRSECRPSWLARPGRPVGPAVGKPEREVDVRHRVEAGRPREAGDRRPRPRMDRVDLEKPVVSATRRDGVRVHPRFAHGDPLGCLAVVTELDAEKLMGCAGGEEWEEGEGHQTQPPPPSSGPGVTPVRSPGSDAGGLAGTGGVTETRVHVRPRRSRLGVGDGSGIRRRHDHASRQTTHRHPSGDIRLRPVSTAPASWRRFATDGFRRSGSPRTAVSSWSVSPSGCAASASATRPSSDRRSMAAARWEVSGSVARTFGNESWLTRTAP